MGALIARYIAEILPKQKSQWRETSSLKKFIRDYPLFTHKLAADFGKLDVVYWRDKRLREVKSETVRREWVTLSSIFSHAVKTWGVLEHNPFLSVTKPDKSISAVAILALVAVLITQGSRKLPIHKIFGVMTLCMYLLGFKILGVSVHTLQLMQVMPTHALHLPTWDFIGWYATQEGLIAQIVFLAMIPVVRKLFR